MACGRVSVLLRSAEPRLGDLRQLQQPSLSLMGVPGMSVESLLSSFSAVLASTSSAGAWVYLAGAGETRRRRKMSLE